MQIATDAETRRRDEVMSRIVALTAADQRIKLPAFDPARSRPSERFALQSIEDNDFSGTAGPFRYQFEGEDDLLHLIVARIDGEPLTAEEGREIAAFLMPNISPGVIWLKPGHYSQHFYLGHDELLGPPCSEST